jgi:ABC-type branched-subunit amino acid transport system permease subunit
MAEYALSLVALVGIFAILAMSYDLVLGYTGMLSIAHGAFFGIGAYATALSLLRLGLPFWAALLLSFCVAAVVAALIAGPATRLAGDYLVVASLGFAVIVHRLMLNLTGVTRGSMGLPGIPPPTLFGHVFRSGAERTLVVCLVAAGCGLVVWRLAASPFGRVLKSIRDDPMAALACGKDVVAYKVTVLAVASGLAGIAGGLYATYVQFIDPESFILDASFLVVMIVVFGGRGTFWGPIMGAAAIWTLPEILRFLALPAHMKGAANQMLYAVLLIAILISRPQGLLGHLARPKGPGADAEA